MVDRVARKKRVAKREAELKTPVPRFASSPAVRRGGMTPAARRLAGRVVVGTPMERLREGWTPRAA